MFLRTGHAVSCYKVYFIQIFLQNRIDGKKKESRSVIRAGSGIKHLGNSGCLFMCRCSAELLFQQQGSCGGKQGYSQHRGIQTCMVMVRRVRSVLLLTLRDVKR